MKRRKTTLAVLAALALTLAACGGDTEGGDGKDGEFSGKLSILTKFGGETLSPYFQDIADAYVKEHPDVEIELIQETDQSIKDKTKTMTASGTLPDIYFTWTGNWAKEFVDAGAAADLSDVIKPGTEWGDTFGEGSLNAFAYDGKYYAVPLYVNAKFMGYNTEAFDKAGISVPETWEDLMAACPKLKGAGYDPISFGNKDGWPGLHFLGQLFAQNVSQETLLKDFDPETATWDDPGYIKGMEQYSELINTCTDSGSDANGVLYTSAQEAFASGKSAMYYQELLEFDNWLDDPTGKMFGFFKLPPASDAAGDPDALEGSPEGYIINASSKQKDLAIDFMKYVTNDANAKAIVAQPYGQPSAVKGAVTKDSASEALSAGVGRINEAKSMIVWLDTVTVPDVADAWLAGGEALVSGDMTPDQVLESVRKANEAAK